MDKEEFERAQPPAKLTRSKLDPYADQLFDLRRKGYVLRQLKEWLAGNKVKVQLETIRKFLNAREKFYEPTTAKEEVAVVEKPGKPRAVGKENGVSSPAGKAPETKTVGQFEIKVPKKFTHNPAPDDSILE